MNKRFFIDKDSRTIVDNVDDSYCECVESYGAKEYCNKLNTLNNENQLLKNIMSGNDLNNATLIKDNVLLRQKNRMLQTFIKQLTNEYGEIVLLSGIAYNVKKILSDVE